MSNAKSYVPVEREIARAFGRLRKNGFVRFAQARRLSVPLQVFALVIAQSGQDAGLPSVRAVGRFKALGETCANALDIHAVRPCEDGVGILFHLHASA